MSDKQNIVEEVQGIVLKAIGTADVPDIRGTSLQFTRRVAGKLAKMAFRTAEVEIEAAVNRKISAAVEAKDVAIAGLQAEIEQLRPAPVEEVTEEEAPVVEPEA